MKKIIVEVDKVNSIIADIENVLARNDVESSCCKIETENGVNISISLSEMLIPRVIQARTKDLKKSNKIEIDVANFQKAIDHLGKESVAANIKEAQKITGVSISAISNLYRSQAKKEWITQSMTKRLRILDVEESNYQKNLSVVLRVAKALKTNDPNVIAKKITDTLAIREQTTFRSPKEVINFVKNAKELV